MARPLVVVDLKCAWCGRAFQRRRSDHEKSVRLGSTEFYCGKACSQAHHAVKNAKPCATCGKPVVLAGRSRGARYCSPKCKPSQVRLLPKSCPQCGGEFQPKLSTQVYCGATCANTAHAIRMRGTTNSNYRTGSESAYLYGRMRPLILERDKACVVCWAKKDLHCHHINEDRNDNAPENLVMLCAAHHMEHHRSAQTPFSWLSGMAKARTSCMTSKWKTQVASLQETFL